MLRQAMNSHRSCSPGFRKFVSTVRVSTIDLDGLPAKCLQNEADRQKAQSIRNGKTSQERWHARAKAGLGED